MTRKHRLLLAIVLPAALACLPRAAWAGIPDNVDFLAEQTMAGFGNWTIVKDEYLFGVPEWQDGDNGVNTQLYVYNSPDSSRDKNLWFEAVYSEAIPNPLPTLDVIDPGEGVTPSAPEIDGLVVTWHWLIHPQPDHEIIKFPNIGFYDLSGMSKIRVATYCVPTPATLSLLTLGGLLAVRRRR